MRELLRTSDPVTLLFVEARLASAGIDCLILDRNVGAIYGGALPARIMVDDDSLVEAKLLLAGLGIQP